MRVTRGGIIVIALACVCLAGCAGPRDARQVLTMGRELVSGGLKELRGSKYTLATDCSTIADPEECRSDVAAMLFIEPRLTYVRTQYATILGKKGTIIGYTPSTKKSKGGTPIYYDVDQAVADAIAKTPILDGESPLGATGMEMVDGALRTGKYLQ